MPYLYRRKKGFVDLLIEKFYRKKIIIRDGASEGGTYRVAINGVVFTFDDPTPAADSSAAIAAGLEALISASNLNLTSSVAANVITLLWNERGVDFSLDVSTSDENGSVSYQDAPHEAVKVNNATNWDGLFATIDTVPLIGKASPSTGADPTPNGMILDGYIRWRFNPSDYSLDDDDVLFFTFTPVYDGVDGDESPVYILLTNEQINENHTALILSGTAPAASGSDSALEFNLPSQTTSMVVKNIDAANDLYLSFGTGEAEIPLAPDEVFRDNKFGSGDIRVRGDGGTADVYIYLTLNFQRIL